MDVVQVFNDELQSLFETKPPVSKAKMGQITRAAMKGVKFYKHIVLSVEKFIAKCGTEYKVPGLYVIDSIVRQSRHQFGIDRDVYAARFSRNLRTSFSNLFSGCSADDKPKIVRVLNLWQKNGVFDAQTISPLLDMASPGATLPAESIVSATSPKLESSKHAQTSKYIMNHFSNPTNSARKNTSPPSKMHGGFSKTMLDFDYDEDDDDDGDETPTEAEPPLSSTLSKIEMEQRARISGVESTNQSSQMNNQQSFNSSTCQVNYVKGDQDLVLERWNRLIQRQPSVSRFDTISLQSNLNSILIQHEPIHFTRKMGDISHQSSTGLNGTDNKRMRSRSRSPVRPKSNETTQKEWHNNTQVVARPKSPVDELSKARAAERELERDKMCLPKIRDKHLTVCSSTLWLGHVPKTVSEADISDAFGEYGAINSIDLIPPRGCAYVCMDRRQDAKKALSKSRDLKLNGSHIKMAWAPGKGFKEYKKLKDFWESDIGASYIPFSKIDSSIDFEVLEEGGVIDEDSMSMEMRESRERKTKEKQNASQPQISSSISNNLPVPTLPILSQPPPFAIPPPTSLNIPPPTVLGHGIPFPPPNVSVASSNHPMPTPMLPTSMHDQHNSRGDSKDEDQKKKLDNSPSALIDQQLTMTERQISMVEQQLNMIQQAQNMNHPQPLLPQIHPQALFPPSQPNPMMFDLPPPHQLHLHHGGLDSGQGPGLGPQQIPIFGAHPQMLAQPPPHMISISQANMDPSMNGNPMPHFSGHY